MWSSDASASTLQRLDILSVRVTDISNGVDHIKEGVRSMSIDVKDVQYTTTATSNDVETLLTFQNSGYPIKWLNRSSLSNYATLIVFPGEHFHEVCDWLSPLAREFERKQQDLLNLEGLQNGIRNWFFDTPEFHSWIAENGRLLWCSGIRTTPFHCY